MENLLNEIIKGLENGLYQMSLSMTLCIPDICASLQSEHGETSGKKYKEWYEENMSSKSRMSANDCYYFRCSMLHQSTTEHEKSSYNKIIFVEPRGGVTLHNNVLEGALNIDINIFCRDMIKAAMEWYKQNKDTEIFKENYQKSFNRYEEGLPPYIVGIPVYA